MRQVKIKPGAMVFVDFRFWRWPDVKYGDSDIVFDVGKRLDDKTVELIARNFGLRDSYGNGSVYAKEQDLVSP